jgi:hypothetical protein
LEKQRGAAGVKKRTVWVAASVCLIGIPSLGLITFQYGDIVGRIFATGLIFVGVVMLIKNRS